MILNPRILFTLLVLITFSSQAQINQPYYEIPEEKVTLQTQVYGELNVAQLKEKIHTNQLVKSVFVDQLQHHELDHFFNTMLPGIKVNIKELNKLGISTNEDVSFNFQMIDYGTIRMSFQLTIEDKPLLLSKIEEVVAANDHYETYFKAPDEASHTFIISDYYSRVKLTNLTVQQDKVLFSVVVIKKKYVEEAAEITVPYEYTEPADSVYEEEVYEEEMEEMDEGKDYQKVIDSFAPLFSQLLASDNGKKSLPLHVKSEIEGKQQEDVYFWLDYAIFQEAYYKNIYSDIRSLPVAFREFLIQSMVVNNEEASYLLGITFEDGEIATTLKSYFHERWKSAVKKYMKSSFNRSMLKYLSKDYLFCGGYSINPQPIVETFKKQYYPLLDSLYSDYAPTVKGFVEILDLIIDEKALYRFVEGDIIFSFNGIQEVEVEVQQRVYDENYEYTFETVIQKRKVPNITLMLSTKDEERWEKIINMGSIAKNYFQPMNGYYTLSLGREGNFYFAVKNGVVMATTDKELVTHYLDSGLPKAMTLSKQDKKVFKKNNLVLLAQPLAVVPDERAFREYKKFTDGVKFKRMDIKGGKVKGNSMLLSSSIAFDTENNSFDHLIETLDLFMKKN